MATTLLEPGRNCWRIERADRAALIVDADAYFAAAREAMRGAKRRIMLIGWDFDARIRVGDAKDGAPATIGDFILWLVKRRPELEVYLLRWDFGAIKSMFRGTTPFTLMRWWRHGRIHVKLDAMHPPGASHHQKIVVIDDCVAFCGGIDMTGSRWDTREHRDKEPGRRRPTTHRRYGPWHDAAMAVDGAAARALGDLGRNRWRIACDAELACPAGGGDPWPEGLEPQFRDVEIGIARTRGKNGDHEEVREIEALFVDMIGAARGYRAWR